MRKNLDSVISILFFFFWFACLTSQSLMDLADFLLLATGLCVLISKARASGNWRLVWPQSTPMKWVWLVWILIVAIGLYINNPINKNTLVSFAEFRWIISFQILCFMLSLMDWTTKKIKWLVSIALVMSVVSFILFPISTDFRAGGPFQHSMPFAHTYGPTFVFIAGIFLVSWRQKSSWRWLALITTIASGVISTLSMTRGVWAAMFGSVIFISFFSNRKQGLILTSGLCFVFTIVLALSPDARERAMVSSESMVKSDNQRMALLKGNFEIVKDYPLLGTGYSQNKHYLKPYYEKLGYPKDQFASHAHNQYLHFWAGTGTLGLLCFLWFLSTTLFVTAWAYKLVPAYETTLKALTLGSLGGQICFIIGSLTESNFSIAKNRYMYLLISSIGVSIYYRYVAKENFNLYQEKTY